MRIGFLFNHDQIHQVAHSLPVALALADISTGVEIVVATTNGRLTAEVVRMCGAKLDRIRLVQLGLTTTRSRALSRAFGAVVPAAKFLIYGDNLDFFRSLDLLVVAEKTSLILKTRYGLDRLKIVHTRHGAGDRAIGFNPVSARFDHVLVSGPKIRGRLVAEAKVDPGAISMVGYPKFDVVEPAETASQRDDDRPIVVYNPHVSPHLSSWFRMGREVLDWFVRHDEYRLIFAPHVMLFERPFVVTIDRLRIDRPGRIDERYLNAPNIQIDLGSRASTTMAYTNRADIYLGDVSSQLYEFIARPRPCVFLNAHGFQWENDVNFKQWHAGPVIRDAADLGKALRDACAKQKAEYGPVQEKLFAHSFDITDEPSSLRAARAVARVAGLPLPDSQSRALVQVAAQG